MKYSTAMSKKREFRKYETKLDRKAKTAEKRHVREVLEKERLNTFVEEDDWDDEFLESDQQNTQD